MKVLVIGGTGLVGPYLLQEMFLMFRDIEIHTINRTGIKYFTETTHRMDRNDLDSFENLLIKILPDMIIDMVPFSKRDAENTSEIINKVNSKIPVIAISSIDVYAAYAKLHKTENIDYQQCPISEDMDLRQKLGAEGAIYDKLNAEKVYRQRLQNLTIMRLPATYGWPDTRRVEPYLSIMLKGQQVIEMEKTKANWKFSRCLHKNAAYAVVLAIKAALSGHHIFNVAEEKTYTDKEWFEKIAQLCGWRGDLKIVEDQNGDVDFNQNFYVSTNRIRTELGFSEKYNADEGLAETIKLFAYDKIGGLYKPSY